MRQPPPALIVLDLSMPVMDRRAFLRAAAGQPLDLADLARRLALLQDAAWDINALLDHWVDGAADRPTARGPDAAARAAPGLAAFLLRQC